MLKKYSIQELNDEINKRLKVLENVPEMVKIPNIKLLRDLCNNYMFDLQSDNVSADVYNDFYENVLDVFYGPEIWDYIYSVEEINNVVGE